MMEHDLKDEVMESFDSMTGGKVPESIKQAKDKAAEMARNVAESIDGQRERVASGLSKTASAVQQGGDKVTGMAQGAAQSLDSTADYIRHNDLGRMMSDVGTVVKNNPGPSIIVAVVLGFFLGRAITGREA